MEMNLGTEMWVQFGDCGFLNDMMMVEMRWNEGEKGRRRGRNGGTQKSEKKKEEIFYFWLH